MPREFFIGDRRIADDTAPYVICEVSHNHLGSFELAKEMVRLAAEAGADAVKFQKRGFATYAGLCNAGEEGYANMRNMREFGVYDYCRLLAEAHHQGVHFIATAFDEESANFLHSLKGDMRYEGSDYVDAIKIASGDITNIPLLEYVAKLGKPMIVSTGGCDMADVAEAHQTLTEAGANFCLLHCTSEYPCPPEHANLGMIPILREDFPATVIGFSSHLHRDAGTMPEAVAAVLGAHVIEKHFTITPSIGTGEHAFALTPWHLKILCMTLKALPSLCRMEKRVLEAEATGILRLGKHLAYTRAIAPGQYVGEGDLAVVGGGKGVPPNQLKGLIGGILTRAVEAGEDVAALDIQRQYSCQPV